MNSQRSCYTFEDPRDPRLPDRELPVENIFIGFRKVKKKKENVLEYGSFLSQFYKYLVSCPWHQNSTKKQQLQVNRATHPVDRQHASGNHLPGTYSESGVSQTGQLRYWVAAGQDICCVGEGNCRIPLSF